MGAPLAITHDRRISTPSGIWPLTKRGFDLVVALCLIVILAPLLLAIAIAVRLDSRGPALFRQERLGRGRRPFRVCKFRTMVHNAPNDLHREYIARLARGEVEGDGLKKLVADPRVTRVGRILRRTSLDELPQLFNVVSGEMSLVGPRPAIEYELESYGPGHERRFEVRPGITGLWQVSGRNRLGFVEMLDLDIRYVEEMGPWTDLKILVRTPKAIVGKAA